MATARAIPYPAPSRCSLDTVTGDRAEHVRGEHRGARRRLIGCHQREIQTLWISAESCVDAASLEPSPTQRRLPAKRQIRVGVGGACVMQRFHRVPLDAAETCMIHYALLLKRPPKRRADWLYGNRHLIEAKVLWQPEHNVSALNSLISSAFAEVVYGSDGNEHANPPH